MYSRIGFGRVERRVLAFALAMQALRPKLSSPTDMSYQIRVPYLLSLLYRNTMILSQKGRLAITPNILLSASRRVLRRPLRSRVFSTKPDDVRPEASLKARARIERINSRLPKFLRGYTAPLVNAPLSHILAFLVLHELTAVVPLFALAGTFHYTKWLPSLLMEGKWVAEGVDKFGRYFRKKGWLEEGSEGPPMAFGRGESGTRIVVEYVYRLSS